MVLRAGEQIADREWPCRWWPHFDEAHASK